MIFLYIRLNLDYHVEKIVPTKSKGFQNGLELTTIYTVSKTDSNKVIMTYNLTIIQDSSITISTSQGLFTAKLYTKLYRIKDYVNANSTMGALLIHTLEPGESFTQSQVIEINRHGILYLSGALKYFSPNE